MTKKEKLKAFLKSAWENKKRKMEEAEEIKINRLEKSKNKNENENKE